jgi:hypothetical protein
MNSKDEFYIGWEEKAPASFARTGRRFVWVVLGISLLVAVGWVLTQRGFADSNFELGTLSEIEGVLVMEPTPMLKVNNKGKVHSVILIGFGKTGAGAALEAIAQKEKQDLEGKGVRLRGTLIYHNGKTLLELTQGLESFVGWTTPTSLPAAIEQDLGSQRLLGEILDPKCALGVMKPGFGKPHRSCAIRCLSGGIPAVMRIKNKGGVENYCLILGRDGKPVNKSLLSFVADQVSICGQLSLQDDWLVLYTNPEEDILRLKPYWAEGNIPMCK